jgi:hypothetical protein
MRYPLGNTGALFLLVVVCSSARGQFNGAPERLPHVVHDQDVVGAHATVITTNLYHEPLFEALQAVNEEYGWAISYEGAPTIDSSEIAESDPELHRAHPELTGMYYADTEPFSSTFSEIEPYKVKLSTVIEQIVTDYNASNRHGKKFHVVVAKNGYYSVVGHEHHLNGAATPFVSPLECVLTLEDAPATIFEAERIVADAVTTTCKKVNTCRVDASLDAPTMSFAPTEKVAGSYVSMSARDILMDLVSQLHQQTYYSMYFVPVDGYFGLTVWGATRKVAGWNGNLISEPVPNPNRKMSQKQSQVP